MPSGPAGPAGPVGVELRIDAIMSETGYQIVKWKEVFETSDSRRYKTLTWVSLPIGGDSTGYLSLIEEFGDDAAEIYGAWCALLSVAARSPTRGQLVDSRLRPYSISRIATQTRMKRSAFERLFEWALTEDVGWLEVIPPNDNQPIATQATNDSDPVANQAPPQLPNLTKPNLTKPNVRTLASVRPLDEEEFDSLKPRCTELKKAVDPNPNRKLKPDDRELCVKAVLFEHAGLIDLNPLMLSLKRSKPTTGTRWGYFKGALKNAIESAGHDFHSLYRTTSIPSAPEPCGASP